MIKILQPISLFMLSLFQLIFCLEHESVLFLIVLCVVMYGFFIELRDTGAQGTYGLLCKIILCLECLYVMTQYALNIYKIDGLQEAERKEELSIVLGIGNYQQLGYNEDDIPVSNVLFPFNISVIFLLILAIFTRYLGKPRIGGRSSRYGARSGSQAGGKRGTELSSERGGRPLTTGRDGDDDAVTVLNDDNLSISGYSDLRS